MSPSAPDANANTECNRVGVNWRIATPGLGGGKTLASAAQLSSAVDCSAPNGSRLPLHWMRDYMRDGGATSTGCCGCVT